MAKSPINQGPPRGAYEDLELRRRVDLNSIPLGNAKARDVRGGGPGRGATVHPSGGQQGLPTIRSGSDDGLGPWYGRR